MHDAGSLAKAKATSHFCTRAVERHGLILTSWQLKNIIDQSKYQKAEFLKWSEGGGIYRSFYRVEIYDQPYIVLFDLEIDALITIYHNSWLRLVNGEWVPRRRRRKSKCLETYL